MVCCFQEKESWDMNTEEKIEAAGKKKEEGNGFFKAGKYAKASKRYEKVRFCKKVPTKCFIYKFALFLIFIIIMQAAKYIEYDTSFGEEEKKAAKALKVTCNLNNAACQLKLKEYKQAEKLCTKVTTMLC